MKGTTRLLALCGVLTALGVVLLCLGGIVPFALYICPILASIALLPVRSRPRYAWCCYGAIALLGLLLCPDKEVSLLFCFTGYYPPAEAPAGRPPQPPSHPDAEAAVGRRLHGGAVRLDPLCILPARRGGRICSHRPLVTGRHHRHGRRPVLRL